MMTYTISQKIEYLTILFLHRMYLSVLISIVGIYSLIIQSNKNKNISDIGIAGIDYIAIDILDNWDQGVREF